MCGRYRIRHTADEIEERYGAGIPMDLYRPNYNAAPSQYLPVISNVNLGEISFYKWGLIPLWAKDPSIGNNLINARAETITEKPSFKGSFKYWRCLVIADGFYEWKKEGTAKQPYLITLQDESIFSFAGLWAEWSAPDGTPIQTFTIITTAPNSLMETIHFRMPVILNQRDERRWLDTRQPLRESLELLKPFPSERMKAIPVSLQVNSPANNFPFDSGD